MVNIFHTQLSIKFNLFENAEMQTITFLCRINFMLKHSKVSMKFLFYLSYSNVIRTPEFK